VHALARHAVDFDVRVSEKGRDEIVECGFLERARSLPLVHAVLGFRALEFAWAFDFLREEIGNIDGSRLATEHPTRDAAALDASALIVGHILGVACFLRKRAVGEIAVETLELADPELKVAVGCGSVAGDRCLRVTIWRKEFDDLGV
jgi:hypothetical protein